MKITKLTLQGFKSFTDPQTLDYTLYDGSLIFVSGDNQVEPKLGANGVGKSVLFSDALSWVLFGKTSTNLRASDIHSWSNSIPTKVTLEFDGYILERTWSPNSLTLDGQVIVQEELEEIIGMNFDSFQYSVLISQFSNKFIDLSSTQRLEVFTEIMDEVLGDWDSYKDKAKIEYEKKKEEIETLSLEISKLEGELKSLDLKYLKIKEKEFEEERKSSIQEIRARLDIINIRAIEIEVEELESRKEDLEESLIYIQTVRKELEDKKQILQNERIEKETKRGIFEAKIEELKEQLEMLSKSNSICPTCGGGFKNKEIRIQSFEEELEDIIEEYEIMTDIVIDIKDSIDTINDSLYNNQNEYRNKIKEISELNMGVNRKERKLGQITEDYENNIAALNSFMGKENPYSTLILEGKIKINYIKRILLHKKDSLESTKKEYEIAKYWTKGFKDIKLMLTEESLYEFGIEINNNLQNLGMNDWNIELGIDSETKSGSLKKGFTILVKSPTNDKLVPFECWSGGEGQRIRMAVTLGLSDFIKNRRGVYCNIMVFDEPSQHLSDEGIGQLLECLNTKVKNDNISIFYIDHRSLDSSGLFDAIVKIIKTDKGSEVIQ